MMLVDEKDITLWANQRNAQSLLPKLIRRLIIATVTRINRLHFRTGDGVQFEGWDGILEAEEGPWLVPDGVSCWECSTSKNIKRKADSDYEKRSRNPRGINPSKSTFVFVTPRRWSDKEDWQKTKRNENFWHNVLAYDVDDIETWLELAPAVHIWFSILLGKHPENAIDLENFWMDWLETTQPPLSHETLLTGRDEVVKSVHTWFNEPVAPLALQADTRDEALAVFAATLQQLPLGKRVYYLSRAVIVRDISAWYRLTASDGPLILTPLFDSRNVIVRALRNGHHVVIPLGRADSAAATTISIPRLSREDVEKFLISHEYAEDQARKLALTAYRSFTSFRRRLAISPEVQQPEWILPEHALSLLPALLAGTWNDSHEGDINAIEKIADEPYDNVRKILMRWSNESDPPVSHVGDKWFIVSKEDAWSLLSRYLTRSDIERFTTVVLDVLGVPDPRFDLPSDQRWMASVLGSPPRHSSLLYEGLADTLALMGTYGDTPLPLSGIPIRDYAAGIIRQLLERANSDWRIWASLSSSLPLIAEGAPNEFLTALENDLNKDQPVLLNLFSDKAEGIFNFPLYTGLLWAFESLAWNPDYFSHAVLILARLARLNPEGMLNNRPMDSLREIFLLWNPQTKATLKQCFRVIDNIRQSVPEVAWELLNKLLPESHSVGQYTYKPRWRDWALEPSDPVTYGEIFSGTHEVISRMLADVGDDGYRWKNIIEALPKLPKKDFEEVLSILEKLNLEKYRASDQAVIRDALRDIISRHRAFSDATWALPTEIVDRIYEVYQRFIPEDPIARYSWLFDGRPNLPEGNQKDHEKYQETLKKARRDAIYEIYEHVDFTQLLDSLEEFNRPRELGLAFGLSELLEEDEDKVLKGLLASENTSKAQFARGFVFGRIGSQGRDWAERKIANVSGEWTPEQRADFFICLPFDERTWDLVENSGPDVDKFYWRHIHPYKKFERTGYERATRKLLEYNRPFTSVVLLDFNIDRGDPFDVNLIIEAFERSLQAPLTDDPQLAYFTYNIAELLDKLTITSEIDESRVAKIEWWYLPIIKQHDRNPRLLLHELSRNPIFFTDVIKMVYFPEGEDRPELSENERIRIRMGHELLNSFRRIPGLEDEDKINAEFLIDWIWQARELNRKYGLREIGDEIIGQILSNSPHGENDIWPHQAICDVIQEVASNDLERGFEVGVINSRGVVSKSPKEGGAQERKLADQYDGYALIIQDRWPLVGTMLRKIANYYRELASREDQRSEQWETIG